MTCQCGAEFCWECAAFWKDHHRPDRSFQCPNPKISLQHHQIRKERHQTRRFYYEAIRHRHERTFTNRNQLRDHAKRLLSTIPLEKSQPLDATAAEREVQKREAMLRHLDEMLKYINYLHRVCEYLAVSADKSDKELRGGAHVLQMLDIHLSGLVNVLETGRGYAAIEQLKELYERCEKQLERLRRMAAQHVLSRANGYATS
jgi:hypothetical protein